MCPSKTSSPERDDFRGDEQYQRSNTGMKSYKGAVSNGHKDVSGVKNEALSKGKGKGVANRDQHRLQSSHRDNQGFPRRDESRQGKSFVDFPRPTSYVSHKGLRQRFVAVNRGVQKLKTSTLGKDLPDPKRLMLDAFHSQEPTEQRLESPNLFEEREVDKAEVANSAKPVQRESCFRRILKKNNDKDVDMGLMTIYVPNPGLQVTIE